MSLKVYQDTVNWQAAINRNYAKKRKMYSRVTPRLEHKYVDHAATVAAGNLGVMASGGLSSSSLVNVAGAGETWCSIAQGSGPSQRDGYTITVTGIHLRGCIRYPETATIAGGTNNNGPVRFMYALIVDNQPNGVLLTPSDIFEGPGLASAQDNADVGCYYPFRKPEHEQRFKVLKIGTGVVKPALGKGVAEEKYAEAKGNFECNVPMNLAIRYGGTAGTIGDQVSKSINLLVWCDDAAKVEGVFWGRTRFINNM